MRRWMIGMAVVWAVALGAAAAQACMICGTSLDCAMSPAGGRWCISGNAVCVVGGACMTSTLHPIPLEELGLVQMTILEDAAGAGAAPAKRVPGAGEVAVGREAIRIARGPRAPFAGDEAIVFSGRGYSEGGTALFRSGTGDGFTLSIEADGRGARVRVGALAGAMPGRVLADERVGENDALVVRIPFEGRTRVLVLAAATLPRAEALQREKAAASAIRESGFASPDPVKPPFELRVLDR